jgi:hypothetical protein
MNELKTTIAAGVIACEIRQRTGYDCIFRCISPVGKQGLRRAYPNDYDNLEWMAICEVHGSIGAKTWMLKERE